MTSKDELQTWLDYHEMAGYEYQQLVTPGKSEYTTVDTGWNPTPKG